MKKYRGIFPALVTPYDEKGKVDADRMQRLVEKNLRQGVAGFYVGGSTAESYLLSMDERKYALEAVMEVVQGTEASVIANVGVFATEHGLALADHARRAGVSAISSVPPFYFPFCMEEYIHYYNTLAERAQMPVILYNIPAMSGVTFKKADIQRLFENENIIGMKHTSYDLFQLQQLIREYPEKNIFIGHDEILLCAFSVGAEAAIGSTFNFMAEKFVRLAKLMNEGKQQEALKLQDQANRVIQVLCEVGVFKGVKAALKFQGYDCGLCREPFLPLSEREERRLYETLLENDCL